MQVNATCAPYIPLFRTKTHFDFWIAQYTYAIDAITRLKNDGFKQIKMMCLVASPQGVKALQEKHPDVDIYLASLDEGLNEKNYILPGLGDAGDRIFGTK